MHTMAKTMMHSRLRHAILLGALALASPQPGQTRSDGPIALRGEDIDTPAPAGSREPSLFATDGGRIYLSWVEAVGNHQFALRFSAREGNAWSSPRTIAQGENWFINWADFPALTGFGDGYLAAHWREKNGGSSPYAYDIKLSISTDEGRTWSQPIVPHRDATPTQHGFISTLPEEGNRLTLVWLDGRETVTYSADDVAAGSMNLRSTTLNHKGELSDEAVLDSRVCTCCQTAATKTDLGILVAYRDRTFNEIRDIAVIRRDQGEWKSPRTVHDDRWVIAGCPINGPAIDARGNHVALVWFSGANNEPRIKLAFSTNGGSSFSDPFRVDSGHPLGRVDVILLSENTALVSWLELSAKGPELRARRVSTNAPAEPAVTIVNASSRILDGFPRMARSGNTIYFSWIEEGPPSRIRVTLMHLGENT